MEDPYASTSGSARIIGIVVLVLGILALVAGVIYFTVPAHSLPALLGKLPNVSAHRTKRGIVAAIAGAVLVIAAGITLARSRRAA